MGKSWAAPLSFSPPLALPANSWADGVCEGNLIGWVEEHPNTDIDIVERVEGQDGLDVLPRRW